MRGAPLLVAAAATAVLLSGCQGSGDDGEVVEAQVPTTAAEPGEDAAATTAPADQPPGDPGRATTAPTTDAAATTGIPGPDAAEGDADGRAAAEVATAFFLAMIAADPEACDHLISFSDPGQPMTAVSADLEVCQEILPAVLQAEVEAQGLDEQGAAVSEAMAINGADVTGDTAVIDRDNFSPPFDDSIGAEVITLQRIDDRWYVDLDNSFASPTP